MLSRTLSVLFPWLLVGAIGLQADEPRSPRLQDLQKAIAAGDPSALARFWAQVGKEGTPLVEPAERVTGASWEEELLVTYLYRGGDETRNVVLVASAADLATAEGIDAARLERMALTDLWFLSRRMGSDARFDYSFSVNDSLEPLSRATPEQEEARFATLIPDPLNPRRSVDPQSSLVELPKAPPQPWTEVRPGTPRGGLEERTLRSTWLDNERIVRVYTPPGYDPKGAPYPLVVFFDGRTYTDAIPTPTILDNLLAARRIEPLVAVFVGNPSAEARTNELSCNPWFTMFLLDDLEPLIRQGWNVQIDPARRAVVGSSLGGLAAACMAFFSPGDFGNVLTMSGSFYWQFLGEAEPESLVRRVAQAGKERVRFYIEAGKMEDRPRPNSPSLLTSNRHLRDVLIAKGYSVEYHEFNGGHSILNWRGSVANGLEALFPARDRPVTP